MHMYSTIVDAYSFFFLSFVFEYSFLNRASYSARANNLLLQSHILQVQRKSMGTQIVAKMWSTGTSWKRLKQLKLSNVRSEMTNIVKSFRGRVCFFFHNERWSKYPQNCLKVGHVFSARLWKEKDSWNKILASQQITLYWTELCR